MTEFLFLFEFLGWTISFHWACVVQNMWCSGLYCSVFQKKNISYISWSCDLRKSRSSCEKSPITQRLIVINSQLVVLLSLVPVQSLEGISEYRFMCLISDFHNHHGLNYSDRTFPWGPQSGQPLVNRVLWSLPGHRAAEGFFCIPQRLKKSFQWKMRSKGKRGFYAFVQSLREYFQPLTLDNMNAWFSVESQAWAGQCCASVKGLWNGFQNTLRPKFLWWRMVQLN